MSDAREKILSAAIDEFGLHGFEKASTNSIMEKAGVSKGLIFHHFGNKAALYITCVRHTAEAYKEEWQKVCNLSEKDILTKLDTVIAYKTKFLLENPSIGRLMLDANKLTREGKMPELAKYLTETREIMNGVMLSGLDMSGYKKTIPGDKIIEFIYLVIEAYSNRYNYEGMSYEDILVLIDDYKRDMELVKDMIRYGVYEGI